MKRFLILSVFSFFAGVALYGQLQYKSKYPNIPIVDVHTHPSNAESISNYVKTGDAIKQKYGSNLYFWIGLAKLDEPAAKMQAVAKNRFLFAVSEMRPHVGLTYTPEEVISLVREGYVGMKFWFGDPPRVIKPGQDGITRIDNPAYERLFSVLEQHNILMTSLHIADPNGPFGNRQNWMKDPVFYWRQIRSFENVVAKYPGLTIVAAHGAWIICQDAQLDYLRYMLTKYPNLYIDISATYQYMPLMQYDNLRSFYIEYQDRILYGSDFGNISGNAIQSTADRYASHFAILETDQIIPGQSRNGELKGLNLPKEVLEKIYYKNACKLYPGLKEAMGL